MMKKVTYLLTMLFAVALLSTSCCEDDPIVPDLTLEEQYPEWSDLTWVSTNGSTDEYPQLDILIIGDVVTLTETQYIGAPVSGEVPVVFTYNGITLTSASIEFNEPDGTEPIRTYEILTPDPGTVKLRYDGDTFVLQ